MSQQKPHWNKGNQFWKARAKHGANKKFTPATLLKVSLEYIEWVQDNPLYSTEVVKYKGDAELVDATDRSAFVNYLVTGRPTKVLDEAALMELAADFGRYLGYLATKVSKEV